MHPVLLEILGFPIHTYGVLIAFGFLLCVWVAKLEARRLDISAERIVDLGFWSLLVGMLGCRLLYILTRLSFFMQNPIEMFYVWEGGLVFYGGILLNLPFFYWFTKKYRMPRWKVLDIAAISVPLAHGFGRLGCLSAGCCYGRPTGGEWGIKLYSPLVDPVSQGIYLHPTQLYESACLFALFGALLFLRKRKQFDGQLLLIYFIAYSIIRSIIETFRGDSIRGFVIESWLSTSQFISILVIIAAMIVYVKRKRTCQLSPASA